MIEDFEYWTKEGFEEAKRRLAQFEEKLAEAQKEKGEAAYGGDTWHDNFAFEEASRQEDMLQRSIFELKARMAKAQLVETPKNSTVVQIGSKVEIQFGDGSVELYTLLDSVSANPSKGIISYNSPLGSAIIGSKLGEEKNFKVGENMHRVKIISIS